MTAKFLDLPAHQPDTCQLSRATPARSSAWYSPAEPRDTCPLICLIIASWAARHLPAHLPDHKPWGRWRSEEIAGQEHPCLFVPLSCKTISLYVWHSVKSIGKYRTVVFNTLWWKENRTQSPDSCVILEMHFVSLSLFFLGWGKSHGQSTLFFSSAIYTVISSWQF